NFVGDDPSPKNVEGVTHQDQIGLEDGVKHGWLSFSVAEVAWPGDIYRQMDWDYPVGKRPLGLPEGRWRCGTRVFRRLKPLRNLHPSLNTLVLCGIGAEKISGVFIQDGRFNPIGSGLQVPSG